MYIKSYYKFIFIRNFNLVMQHTINIILYHIPLAITSIIQFHALQMYMHIIY